MPRLERLSSTQRSVHSTMLLKCLLCKGVWYTNVYKVNTDTHTHVHRHTHTQ